MRRDSAKNGSRGCMSVWIALFPHGTLMRGGVVLTTANRTYAAHSGAECYLHGHRIYVPDGLNYPRQAWAGWGITCRTATPEIAAGSGSIGADSGERPVEWCGWWMRQHLGGRYGPEFNVARNWLLLVARLMVLALAPSVLRLIMFFR